MGDQAQDLPFPWAEQDIGRLVVDRGRVLLEQDIQQQIGILLAEVQLSRLHRIDGRGITLHWASLREQFAQEYTGPDADWSRPCYSPLFADLRGLPPTLVQVGTNEILKSDSERLVENLQKAGVYAQLEVYPECWHVFQQMPIRRAAVAMESAGRFVQRII